MTQPHTPGPWAAVTSDEINNGVEIQDATGISHHATDADLQLMANAPALLEALVDLLDSPDLSLRLPGLETRAAIKKAQAVIDKMEGN
jgi:hypothetical protein